MSSSSRTSAHVHRLSNGGARRASHKQMPQLSSSQVGLNAARMTAEARARLQAWVRAGTTPQRVARRARIVILAAEGLSVRQIARRLETTPRTVSLWVQRFNEAGVVSLPTDASGRGRKPSVTTDAARQRVLTLLDTPGAAWTIRRLAERAGLHRTAVHRILRAAGRSCGRRRPDPAH